MASGEAGENNDAKSSTTSKKSTGSQQLLTSGTGSRASEKHANEKFVLENVHDNGTVKEQKRKIPSFDHTDDDIALNIGNAMASVEKGELKAASIDTNDDSFHTTLQLGFEKMLQLCYSAVDIRAEVRQGSDTWTDIGNFTKCAITSRPDISIVLNNGCMEAVCGLCEVKVDKNYDVHAINQLYVELVSQQRSTQKTKDGAWLLTGLVLTEKRAYITQLRTGTWWGYLAEVASLDRYDFDATGNLSRGYQMLAVIREYLQRLFTNFCTDQLFCATHELAYFAYPSAPDIVRLSAPHIVKCRFKTVRMYLSDESPRWSNECGSDDETVVKIVSNAMYNDNIQLEGFLLRLDNTKREYEKAKMHEKLEQLEEQLRQMKLRKNATSDSATASESGDTKPKEQKKPPTKPPDYVFSLLSNHVWVGSFACNSNTEVCVTRWLGERVCRTSEVLSKWAVKDTRQAFFDHVCAAALGAIKFGYYHGDIRLPNIVVREQDGKFQFSLVDWDEMVHVIRDRGVKCDSRYPVKLTEKQQNLWRNNFVEWAELFTVCQLYMCATILSMVADVPEPEAEACKLEGKWKNEVHFWEQSCANEIHLFDQRHTAGLSMLRSLMNTPPDEHLSDTLRNVLMKVLELA